MIFLSPKTYLCQDLESENFKKSSKGKVEDYRVFMGGDKIFILGTPHSTNLLVIDYLDEMFGNRQIQTEFEALRRDLHSRQIYRIKARKRAINIRVGFKMI